MIGRILFIRTASNFGFGPRTWFREVGGCIAWGLLRHLVHHRKLSTAPPKSFTRSVIMGTSLLSSALARVGRSAAVLQPSGGLPKRMPLQHAIKRGVRLISGSSGTEWTGGAQVGSTLSFETISGGEPLSPEHFEGKAVLVVNTASLCGLTPQLKDLELVHKRFRDSGLVVLGVPSNDFGGQEPWEEDKIKEFYAKDFGVTFPLTSKTVVIGPNAHPFYAAVTAEFGPDAGPQWNFHKLLVGADGALAGVFGSNLSPLEPDVTEAIEEALPEDKGSR